MNAGKRALPATPADPFLQWCPAEWPAQKGQAHPTHYCGATRGSEVHHHHQQHCLQPHQLALQPQQQHGCLKQRYHCCCCRWLLQKLVYMWLLVLVLMRRLLRLLHWDAQT
jgi:hypothetical protein